MGQNSSKKSLKTIDDDVQAIRSSIRQSQGKLSPDTKEALEHVLVNYSKQVDRMGRRSSRKSIDNTQKLIVKTTNELLSDSIEANLDRGAVETNSFINLTKTKRSVDNNSRNLATLDDIEKAINSLKLDINVAISNRDNDRLRILKRSIEHLATSLEMLKVGDYIDLQTRKENFEKTLQNLYGKINKARRQIDRDDNIQYLTEYQEKQQKLINDLADVETTLENSQLTTDELEELKKQVDKIEGNETIEAKKREILTKIQQKCDNLAIIEQKLQQAIDSLVKFQKEIEKICKNPNVDENKKADNYLKQLREYVGKLPDIHREFSEKRQQFYETLEQSANLLKQTSTARNIDGLYSYWMELQEDFRMENYNIVELSSIQQLLSTLLVLVQRKVEEIGEFLRTKQSKDGPDLVKVRVKITETPTVRSSINLQQITDIENELIKLKNNKIGDDSRDVEKLLDNYREILQKYQNSSNQSYLVDDLLALVEEIRENLPENRRRSSSSDDILNEIFLISNRVNDYGAKLKDANLTPEEFEAIRTNLQQYRNNLNGLKLKNSNIKKVCVDVLQQISEYLANLDDDRNAELKQRVNVLKEKIDRFSGTYKNVLYKKLEDDLNDCLEKTLNPQLRNEIENYLKILEEKSIKDTNYNRPVTVNIRDKLSKIREDVEEVISDLSNNDLKTKDDYLALDGRLTLSILALDNLQIIKDRNLIEERENLYHEIQRYLNYINEKITLANQAPPIQEFNDNINDNDNNDEDVVIVELRTERTENQQDAIEEIESKFERIKREINEFIGDQTDERFIKLDDELIEITLNLDRYKFEKNTVMNNKKLTLLKDIQSACELLDEKINHFQQLQHIEQQIAEISAKIQQLNKENRTDYDYNRLDEQLINLNVKTRKLQVDRPLLEKRNNCIRMIEDCFRKLSETPKNCEGTLV